MSALESGPLAPVQPTRPARDSGAATAMIPHCLGRWTEAENAFLVANYHCMTILAMATALAAEESITRAHITLLRKRGLLKIGDRFYHRPWTPNDDQELSGRWAHQSAEAIARQLGRSLTAIRTRAATLHLGRGGPGLTAQQVAVIFGVDSHLILLWLQRGWLAGRRTNHRAGKGCRWSISIAALEAFIIASPYHFDYRVMEPGTWWRELAERETKRQRWLTPLQVSRRLGVHVGTVHQHLRKGWLPGKQTTGASWQGDWRIREADVQLFQARRPIGGKGGCGRPGMRRHSSSVEERLIATLPGRD